MYLQTYILELLDKKGCVGWLVTVLLLPFSGAYYLGWLLRHFFYRQGWLGRHRLSCRVISVGNLTLGGSGKTPAVAMLAGQLLVRGKRVAVLSRGYRGSLQGKAALVSNGKQILLTPAESGDEPFLLAEKLPSAVVMIGKQRYAAGKYLLEKFPLDVIILDDGYQHLALNRDLNILLLDATNPFGNGWLFPRGTLREPLAALSRAQAIIITHSDLIPTKELHLLQENLRKRLPQIPIFESCHRADCLIEIKQGKKLPLNWLVGKRVISFAAIANPQKLRDSLTRLGAEVCFHFSFPDHHSYSPNDIIEIEKMAARKDVAAVITTEKDKVRCQQLPNGERPCLALKISLVITSSPADWEQFIHKLV